VAAVYAIAMYASRRRRATQKAPAAIGVTAS